MLNLKKGANPYMIRMRKLPDKNSKYDPSVGRQSLENKRKGCVWIQLNQ
jgi:hypothetical protein